MKYPDYTFSQLEVLKQQGDIYALEEIAHRKIFGDKGYQKDLKGAIKIIKYLVEEKQDKYAYCLAGLYYQVQDYFKKAIEMYLYYLKVDEPDFDSTYLKMAECYYELKEYDNAIKCYKLRYKYAPAECCRKIAKIYDELEDYDTAFTYFEQGAKLGDIISYNYLGSYYYNGRSVRESKTMAYDIFCEAREKGSLYAKVKIGSMKVRGWGVVKDVLEGFSILKDCYLNHKYEEDKYAYSLAVIELGDCYLNGWGTGKKPEKAFELYNEALKYKENADLAQYSIALCYYDGTGVDVDYYQAYKHAERAYEIKNEDIYKRLSEDALEAYHKYG